MNDGWIPVEEDLPLGFMDVEVTLSDGNVIIGFYNSGHKKWYPTRENEPYDPIDVIAWKEPSEPYRPEN